MVSKQSKASVDETVAYLIQEAQKAGSTDDITVVLLKLAES